MSKAAFHFLIMVMLSLCYGRSTLPLTDPDSASCPISCPSLYEPVCGSDGITYDSICQLELVTCQGPLIHKVSDGACDGQNSTDCDSDCSGIFQPVCGSDGITYDNDCLLEVTICHNPQLLKYSDGECEGVNSTRCDADCSGRFEPVCGSDAITYENDCELEVAICQDPQLHKFSDGECEDPNNEPCPESCEADYQPVCGSNGLTYSNDCELSLVICEGSPTRKVSDGACEDTDPCPESCEADYQPVCGSNGLTYNNDCELSLAICDGNDTRKVFDGACEDTTSQICLQVCDDTYEPVCGTDGNTYANECELNHESCKIPSIVKSSDGACESTESQCEDNCPRTYEPVCGSDGVTYENECDFAVASCQDSSITKVNDGECGCNYSCDSTYDPVCGTDDSTYLNLCEIEYVMCKDSSLSILSNGVCGELSVTTPPLDEPPTTTTDSIV